MARKLSNKQLHERLDIFKTSMPWIHDLVDDLFPKKEKTKTTLTKKQRKYYENIVDDFESNQAKSKYYCYELEKAIYWDAKTILRKYEIPNSKEWIWWLKNVKFINNRFKNKIKWDIDNLNLSINKPDYQWKE